MLRAAPDRPRGSAGSRVGARHATTRRNDAGPEQNRRRTAGRWVPYVSRRDIDAVRGASPAPSHRRRPDDLVERIGDARLVLIGGGLARRPRVHAWRDRLTRRLVTERGFRFVAVEGDWPDSARALRRRVGNPRGRGPRG
ncbi:erythromycin esterase family protein [Pseudonocardia sp. MCCB 268]|nr:erythromycin esterase family protein [Pseudonocardia cytotoxica]